MSRDNSHSHLSNGNVVEFLADREGLAGEARERFRRLLREYGGFHQSSAPRHARTLGFVSLLLTLIGVGLDRSPEWSNRLVWVGYVVLSAGLIWAFRQEENKGRFSDREIDWEAYCLFLRPVILSDHPGLLDRNAKDNRSEPAKRTNHPIPILRSIVHQRGPDFWWSALLGLSSGMLALLVTHLAVTATNWTVSIAFPGGGLLLGLGLWLLWRRLAYVIVKSDSRVVGP